MQGLSTVITLETLFSVGLGSELRHDPVESTV